MIILHFLVLTSRLVSTLEGLHNAVNRTIGRANPTIWKVLKAFQDEETNARLKINHVERGEPAKQARIYRELNERIFNMVSDYETKGREDRIKYLRMISYCLKKVDVIEEENVLPTEPTAGSSKENAKKSNKE